METLKKGTCDFLSFSTYGSNTFTTHDDEGKKGEGNGASARQVANPYLKTNAWGWGTDPQCLRCTEYFQQPLSLPALVCRKRYRME